MIWSIGNIRVHFMTPNYNRWIKSWLWWMPWWTSPNSGVRILRRSIPGQRSRSVALFRSWKDGRWKFHCGFAWKA